MNKQQIREAKRNERENISIIQAAELSTRIAERVLRLPEYRAARTVMSYASLAGEVVTNALNERILTDGKRLYLPRVRSESGMMDAVRVTDMSVLKRGYRNIREPSEGEIAKPGDLDLILVPGLAFDLCGGRIGFGGGFYDRFLAGMSGLRVGLAFETQLVENTCSTETDVPMDILVTEFRTISR